MRTLPTVTLNGTSRDSLVDQNLEASSAVRKAMETVRNAAPHQRDFIGRAIEYGAARQLFESQLYALNAIVDHFHAIAYALVTEAE